MGEQARKVLSPRSLSSKLLTHWVLSLSLIRFSFSLAHSKEERDGERTCSGKAAATLRARLEAHILLQFFLFGCILLQFFLFGCILLQFFLFDCILLQFFCLSLLQFFFLFLPFILSLSIFLREKNEFDSIPIKKNVRKKEIKKD